MKKKIPGLIIILALLAGVFWFIRTNNNLSALAMTPHIVFETNQGEVEIELDRDAAPKTVANFVKLVEQGFYDGTLFHRVIPNFMIQGGDPLTRESPENWAVHGTGGPDWRFDDEPNDIPLERGVIAMANSGVQNGRGTNGSQFFIVTAAKVDWLNTPGSGYHTPFGRVVRGMEVVTKIESARRNENDHPLEDQKIERAYVVEE